MAETIVKEQKVAQVPKVSEPIFGQKERKLLLDPLTENNPITVQILGVCSALAVTSLVAPSVVMAIAVTAVTALSNLVTSMVRNYIPKSVRMIAQLVIVAVLVTIVELILKAYNFTIYKQLSVYIGLIITNCIVMGRLEAFAMSNNPWRSFIDGIGNGLGYGAILIIVGVIRELLGKGTLVGVPIIGASNEQVSYFINTAAESGFGSLFSWYTNNNLMVLPTAAMFIVAIMIWIQRSRSPKLVDIS